MKQTIKMKLFYVKYEWKDTPHLTLCDSDLHKSSPEYALVKEMAIDCECPEDFDPTPQQIENLKEKRNQVMAETQMQINDIDEQIQRLLCIEHKLETV